MSTQPPTSWDEFLNRPVPDPPAIKRSERQFRTKEAAEKALGYTLPDIFKYLYAQPFHEQRSVEWFDARYKAITASDFGPAAGIGTFGSPTEVFRKKTETNRSKPNAFAEQCMAHGVIYEDPAAYCYEQHTGKTILDFGLLTHWKLWAMKPDNMCPKEWNALIHQDVRPECITPEDWAVIEDLRWLKGSPDGITTDGILIEIKCPYRGLTPGHLKEQYRAQVQLNMELANVDLCHFIQYQPKTSWAGKEVMDLFEVHRDGKWFQIHKEKAKKTWDWVTHFRRTGTLPLELSTKLRQVPDESGNGAVIFESTRAKRKLKEVQGSTMTTEQNHGFNFSIKDVPVETPTPRPPSPFSFAPSASDDVEQSSSSASAT